MKWHLNKARPLCPQISEQLCVRIAAGEFLPNTRLLSVREVAISAGVNPNTVQKSFEQLEALGLIYSVRGSGWFVGENIAAAEKITKQLYAEKTAAYFSDMYALGLEASAVKEYVKEWNV